MKQMQFKQKLGIVMGIILGCILSVGILTSYNSLLGALVMLILGSIASITPMTILIFSIEGLIGELKHNQHNRN